MSRNMAELVQQLLLHLIAISGRRLTQTQAECGSYHGIVHPTMHAMVRCEVCPYKTPLQTGGCLPDEQIKTKSSLCSDGLVVVSVSRERGRAVISCHGDPLTTTEH